MSDKLCPSLLRCAEQVYRHGKTAETRSIKNLLILGMLFDSFFKWGLFCNEDEKGAFVNEILTVHDENKIRSKRLWPFGKFQRRQHSSELWVNSHLRSSCHGIFHFDKFWAATNFKCDFNLVAK